MQEVYSILPKTICDTIQTMPPSLTSELEEIRVRVNRPLELIVKGEPYFPNYYVTADDGAQLLNKLSQYSIYAIEEELRRGFITIQGGHRVGLAGKVITEEGKVKAIRHVTSFNIRIARQKIGVAEPLVPFLFSRRWLNTVIIGSPQTGKTTLLRDIARIISTGVPGRNIRSQKIGIVDERSEIAGCVKGVPQFHLGERVDVLDACPKAEGMMMMIRSMSPNILIVDEIGREEDSEAILEAVNAGVGLFMTVHGRKREDLLNRPTLKPIMQQLVFERFIELSNLHGPGTVSRITDREGRTLYKNERVVV